jgi:hypothetical protein
MSEEEYNVHINEFLQGFYGKGWEKIRRVLDILQESTKHRCAGCFDDVDIGSLYYETTPEVASLRNFIRDNYVPKAYQPTLSDHYLLDFVGRIDEIKELYNEAFDLAETDEQRRHLEISRWSVSYVDLFIKPNRKGTMTAEEQRTYEAEVQKFYEDKERFGFRYNLWTSNNQNR